MNIISYGSVRWPIVWANRRTEPPPHHRVRECRSAQSELLNVATRLKEVPQGIKWCDMLYDILGYVGPPFCGAPVRPNML